MIGNIFSDDSLRQFRDAICADNVIVSSDSGQVAGFVFSVERRTDVSLLADITDHFVEDNSYINDHIAVRPPKVTLTGYVGEKILSRQTFVDKFLQSVATRLTPITDLMPQTTNYTQRIYDYMSLGIRGTQNIFKKVDTLWNVSLLGTQQETQQIQAYRFFEALLQNRMLVDVVTPYKVFRNMAIESVRVSQPETTKDYSDFTVTCKQINVAATKYGTVESPKYQGYSEQQMQNPVNIGNVTRPVQEMQQEIASRGISF
jgi:hypothetical protein